MVAGVVLYAIGVATGAQAAGPECRGGAATIAGTNSADILRGAPVKTASTAGMERTEV